MWPSSRKLDLPSRREALPGRPQRMQVPPAHFVTGARLEPPFPAGRELAMFGMGCFWGAERKFWDTPGVYSTAVGYAGGFTPNPTYQQVLSAARFGPITTEIREAPEFYFAEEYHQQYLAKNPWGYCGIGGTGLRCPAGVTQNL